MELPAEGYLLRIFIGESDKKDGRPLYEWIAKSAKEHGIAGATIFRGIQGFGANSRMHAAKLLDLSMDLPMVIEIVDSIEKIEAFMPVLEDNIQEGLATLEKVQIKFYRANKEKSR